MAMRYEVDIPENVSNRLTARASATGDDVVHLIQVAVVRFVQDDAGLPSHRLRPDVLLEQSEISPPVDLPLSTNSTPVSCEISDSSRLRPELLTEPE